MRKILSHLKSIIRRRICLSILITTLSGDRSDVKKINTSNFLQGYLNSTGKTTFFDRGLYKKLFIYS